MQTSNLRPGSGLNQPQESAHTGRSRVKMHQLKAQTCRFGEYKPHFVMDVVPDDRHFSLRSSQTSRSYTLQAPLMQNISLNRDYFVVPLQSLLPFNFDKFIMPPKNGNDVDASKVGFTISGDNVAEIFYLLINFWKEEYGTLNGFRCLAILSMFFSRDSLLFNLEYDFARYLPDDFDDYIERVFYCIGSGSALVRDEGRMFRSYNLASVDGFRSFLLELMENPALAVDSFDITWRSVPPGLGDVPSLSVEDFNLARVLAYQLVCAHFYSNDNVDFVYSADLFRSYVASLCRAVLDTDYSVTWNGMKIPLDFCSAGVLGRCLLTACQNISSGDGSDAEFGIFGLFAYRRSLRFVDYFTGAKTKPLASVDVNFSVNNGVASAVDVTRSIQLQRFANAVQKTGRKLSEYVKSLFGASMHYDYHEPMYLGHTSDKVYTSETENTGAAQLSDSNSTTAVMRSNSSRYAFEFDSDCYGVVLGISYYDVERLYVGGISPFTKMKDRYDYFIPQMQFIGDQPIYRNELPWFHTEVGSDQYGRDAIFGYCLRDMQYKTLVSHVSGGFVRNLPGWSFHSALTRASVINADVIRSRPEELDELYVSLTGVSLSSYFHFILMNDNEVEVSRPMVYQPQILG